MTPTLSPQKKPIQNHAQCECGCTTFYPMSYLRFVALYQGKSACGLVHKGHIVPMWEERHAHSKLTTLVRSSARLWWWERYQKRNEVRELKLKMLRRLRPETAQREADRAALAFWLPRCIGERLLKKWYGRA